MNHPPRTPPGAPAGMVLPGGTYDNPLAMGMPGGPPVVRLPLTHFRQVSLQNLDLSRQTTTPVTVVAEVDMTNLKDLHDRWKPQFEATMKVPLTYLPFFTQATVKGLKAYPMMNSVLTPQGFIVNRHVHMGIATSVPGAVLIPTIWHAESKLLPELARDIYHQTQKAKAGQLPPEEMSGQTFLITNTGRFGQSLFGTPVIKPGTVGTIGFESIVKRPVADEYDQVVVRPMMYVTLTADHRAVDGAEMLGFLGRVTDVLQKLQFD